MKCKLKSNPIITGMYTADPSAHVWSDGRLYIYASHDAAEERFTQNLAFTSNASKSWLNYWNGKWGSVQHLIPDR